MGFPGDSVIKNPPGNTGDMGDAGLSPGSERSPGEGYPLQYFFHGEFHGQRSLVVYSPIGLQKSDTTEQLNAQSHQTGSVCFLFPGYFKLIN